MKILLALGLVGVAVYVLVQLGIVTVTNNNGVVTARVNWNS
jgi:hypothetical protein